MALANRVCVCIMWVYYMPGSAVIWICYRKSKRWTGTTRRNIISRYVRQRKFQPKFVQSSKIKLYFVRCESWNGILYKRISFLFVVMCCCGGAKTKPVVFQWHLTMLHNWNTRNAYCIWIEVQVTMSLYK